jgi:hypothetical protein
LDSLQVHSRKTDSQNKGFVLPIAKHLPNVMSWVYVQTNTCVAAVEGNMVLLGLQEAAGQRRAVFEGNTTDVIAMHAVYMLME